MRAAELERSKTGRQVEAERSTSVEIDVDGRWDALALSELLIPFRSFLVQRDQERWVVHARAPGCHGESLEDALGAIEEWRASRRRPWGVACRLDGRTHTLI